MIQIGSKAFVRIRSIASHIRTKPHLSPDRVPSVTGLSKPPSVVVETSETLGPVLLPVVLTTPREEEETLPLATVVMVFVSAVTFWAVWVSREIADELVSGSAVVMVTASVAACWVDREARLAVVMGS